jgi:transcriptional regulator with XRE-family HTH domain
MRRVIARVESKEKTYTHTKAGHFDADSFYAALDAQRASKGLTWKQVAQAAGVSASTLTRMSRGKRPDVDSLAALSSWSGLTVDDFVVNAGSVRKVSPMAAITAHLRSDPHLAPESAAALADIMKAAYERLRKA